MPPLKRVNASARVAFQRQRLVNIGEAKAAWVKFSSTIAGLSMANTSDNGNECRSTREIQMPSSVAAACNSRSKLTQNRLRSAKPQARLTRPPQGE